MQPVLDTKRCIQAVDYNLWIARLELIDPFLSRVMPRKQTVEYSRNDGQQIDNNNTIMWPATYASQSISLLSRIY